MLQEDLALLLKYPLISCNIVNGVKHYGGVITIQNEDYRVHIIEENKNGNVHFTVKTSFGNKIDEIVMGTTSTNIVDFLDQLTSIYNRNVPKNQTQIFRRVLHEYSEFVKFHLKLKTCSISDNLSTIRTTTVDDGRREHALEIAIDFEETMDIYKPLNLSLPEPFSKNVSKNFSNLTELYSNFVAAIEDLQDCFDVLDDLDRNCCILDPEKPTRKDCYRRIWLDQNLSVLVIIDPLNVRRRPDLKFLGPERLILQYRDKLNNKLDEWDNNTDLTEGLLNVLEIENFPSKPKTNQDVLMDSGECSICFSSRFNNKLPEVICSNKSCENSYHVDCLYEWLTSVNSKRIFNQIRGLCPNCEKGISCPLPAVSDVL